MQLSDGPWFDSGWPDFSTHAAKDANWNTQVVYLPCKACLVFQIYVSMYGMYVTSISERFLIYCLRFQTNEMRNFERSEEHFWQDTSYDITICKGVCIHICVYICVCVCTHMWLCDFYATLSDSISLNNFVGIVCIFSWIYFFGASERILVGPFENVAMSFRNLIGKGKVNITISEIYLAHCRRLCRFGACKVISSYW